MMEVLPHRATLAILAGGEGSRMGRAKGLLTVAGQPILSHIIRLAKWDGPTLLVTAPGRERAPGAEEFDGEVVDPIAGLGPMRGVLTALENTATEIVIVQPVDMPAIGATQLRWLAGELARRPEAMVIFPQRVVDGLMTVEPLPAAFRRGASRLLQERLRLERRSLHGLIGAENVEVVTCPGDWPREVWTNLNDPAELRAFEKNREIAPS